MRTDAAEIPSLDSFQTPPRILIPKLLCSRDGWKRRAGARKKRIKKQTVRIRDLECSRAKWKERARQAETKLDDLREQLQHAQRDRAPRPEPSAPVSEPLKKTAVTPN